MQQQPLAAEPAAAAGAGGGANGPRQPPQPPPPPQPDAKAKRYDRQIRVWGADGQARLEAARIALLGASATGAETLKNLVLAGIASFTIVDGAAAAPRDLGNNFLVDAARLGEPRARVVADCLRELNDAVAGSYVEESPEALLEQNPGFIGAFDLVVATQLREPALLRLDALCRDRGVRLLVARSYGLMGYLRASVPDQLVVDSKPDSQVDDLRVTCPWPALRAWAASFDLAAVDKHVHQHIPYVALLLQALAAWRASLGGGGSNGGNGGGNPQQQQGAGNNTAAAAAADARLPSTAAERSALRAALNALRGAGEGPDGLPFEEENFDEALRAAFHAWTPPSIPPEVRAVLDDPAADSLAPDAPDFWVMVAALRRFVAQEGGGQLPLNGAMPDMHATTELYLQLQRVYRERADADAAAFERHLAQVLAGLGAPGRAISSANARHFVRNARSLRVVRYRSLADEYGRHGPGAARGAALAALLAEEGAAANANLYVLLRACDRFYASHGRFPGAAPSSADDASSGGGAAPAVAADATAAAAAAQPVDEDDVPALKAAAAAVLQELGAAGAASALQDDYVAEMCRLGAAELHVVAAVVGGVAAQEAIKLLTRQFVPFSGSLVYNAMASTTSVLAL